MSSSNAPAPTKISVTIPARAKVSASCRCASRVLGPAPGISTTAGRSYESVPVQLTVLGLLLAAFLAHPVGALVRRVGGGRGPGPAPWAARLLATGGVATVLGAATYLSWLVATGTTRPGPVLLARPVPWLVLQLLAVGVLAAAITLAWRARGTADRARRTVLLGGAVLFVPWAAYWGLLTV